MMLSFELEQSSAALGINMGFVYAVLPLSGLLIVFNCVENIVNCLMNVMEES